jgi:hypothetical protein
MTVEITLTEPHAQMLAELREDGTSNPDADLQKLVEDAIHNGYQQMEHQ